jgi:hypothetical protein
MRTRHYFIMSTTKAAEGDTVANDASADRQRRKNKSILDGTDDVTLAASAKRASKVAPGMFYDASVHYFGDTAVIWDMREFMKVRKWREDAMRRSRNNCIVRKASADVTVAGCGVGGRKRRGEEEERRHTTPRDDGAMAVDMRDDDDGRGGDRAGHKRMPSRKKRFRAMCDMLYQNSLEGGKG